MAEIVGTMVDQPGEPVPRYARAGRGEQRAGVAMLLTGRPDPRDPAVDPFLRYIRTQKLAMDDLWLAWEGDRLSAAVLLVPCPGRTGMLFVCPPTAWPDRSTVKGLVGAACSSQDRGRVQLVQSLLEPEQRDMSRLLADAGFEQLAVLLYMQRRAERSRRDLELERSGFELYHWSEANRDRFACAILASYEQTQDCPRLRGVREIDDILAGHLNTGVHHPHMWYAVYERDEPVAVMLLNETPANDAYELVYLGVSQPYRGRGIARRLLEHGLWQVRQRGRGKLILAVDENNRPAHRLYRELGFEITARRRAMIRVLDEPV